jgi:hypothetical protein
LGGGAFTIFSISLYPMVMFPNENPPAQKKNISGRFWAISTKSLIPFRVCSCPAPITTNLSFGMPFLSFMASISDWSLIL